MLLVVPVIIGADETACLCCLTMIFGLFSDGKGNGLKMASILRAKIPHSMDLKWWKPKLLMHVLLPPKSDFVVIA